MQKQNNVKRIILIQIMTLLKYQIVESPASSAGSTLADDSEWSSGHVWDNSCPGTLQRVEPVLVESESRTGFMMVCARGEFSSLANTLLCRKPIKVFKVHVKEKHLLCLRL